MAEERTKRGSAAVSLLRGDRALPGNEDAEKAVLGCMLLDPEGAVDPASAILSFPHSFFVPRHQVVFETLMDLVREHRSKTGIDLVTVAHALQRAGKLDEVGGQAYLAELMNTVPSAANVEKYAEIVRDCALLRRLISTSADIMDRCYDPQEPVKALVDRVEQEVFSITQLHVGPDMKPVAKLVYGAIEYMEKLSQKDASIIGIQTGYGDLDHLITGLRPGEMFVLAARPSIGKTAFALNIAMNIVTAATPRKVGFFSLEMSSALLVLRLLCSEAQVNMGDIRDSAVSPARWQEIMAAAQKLKKAPLYIDDSPNIDILELRAKARRLKQTQGVDLIMIDYLQMIKPTSQNKNATRENEVSQMSSGIKSLVKELNIPIIVLAQLNRQAEQQGQEPKLSHLRESGAIEQDADVVALLHRERNPEGGGEESEAELIIAKHRNGPCGKVHLTFIPKYTRFASRSHVPDGDVPHV